MTASLVAVRLSFLGAAIFLLGSPPLHACSCMPVDTLEKQMEKYPVIFLGEVVDDVSQDPHRVEAVFRVVRVWKGEQVSRLNVRTNRSPAACGFRFVARRVYVVFASPDGPTLATNSCTPTKGARHASSVIQMLDSRFRVKTSVPPEK